MADNGNDSDGKIIHFSFEMALSCSNWSCCNSHSVLPAFPRWIFPTNKKWEAECPVNFQYSWFYMVTILVKRVPSPFDQKSPILEWVVCDLNLLGTDVLFSFRILHGGPSVSILSGNMPLALVTDFLPKKGMWPIFHLSTIFENSEILWLLVVVDKIT